MDKNTRPKNQISLYMNRKYHVAVISSREMGTQYTVYGMISGNLSESLSLEETSMNHTLHCDVTTALSRLKLSSNSCKNIFSVCVLFS
jgi:hypothetical protein